MNQIHINITGPKRSGKSILAVKVARYIRSLGCRVAITENDESLSPQTLRLHERAEVEILRFEPRDVTINEQWAPSKPSPILEWLINGAVGSSSKTLAAVALGVKPSDISYPHDPDDLNRCLLLMQAAPEVREALPKVAALSDKWAGLVKNWAEIEATFLDEAGIGWTKSLSAQRTYHLMQKALKA